MATIQRNIAFTKGLQGELDNRVHRGNDLVTDITTIDGSTTFDDKYVGANAFKTADDATVKQTQVVDDVTTGGSTDVLSAEQGVYLKSLIDGMSNGLAYQGTFDASTETELPSDASQGDFYKVSGDGTIDGLEMAVGDMIIANKDVSGSSAAADWDKIDNTEAADILRTGDVSTDTDLSVEGTKLTDRATIKSAIDDAVADVSVKATNESVTIDSDTATLSFQPLSNCITMGYVQIDNGDGTIDLVQATVDSDKLMTISPDTAGAYDGKSATVHYLYI